MKRNIATFVFCAILTIFVILVSIYMATYCEHDWEKQSSTATCTENGEITYKCNHCEKQLLKEEPAKGHTLISHRTDPTCVTSGNITTYCHRCDYSSTQILESIDHDYREVSKTSTCLSDGIIKLECKFCKETIEKESKAGDGENGGHTYTEEGSYLSDDYYYLYRKCIVCNKFNGTRLSMEEKQNYQREDTVSGLKEDGFVIFKSGYTYERCIEKASEIMKKKHGAIFSESAVTVATKDILMYYVIGCTKSDRPFMVMIDHSGSEWVVFASEYLD